MPYRRIIHKTKKALRLARRTAKGSIGKKSQQFPFKYSIDSPIHPTIDKRVITIDGWLIPNRGTEIKGVRVTNSGKEINVVYGLKRVDVEKAFPDNPLALQSGFSLETEIADGALTIDVDYGNGYKTIHSINLVYSPEKLVKDYYNPNLASNWAEHLNLLDNKKRYFYEDSISDNYQPHKDDPRLLAFYLPQFHPIPENDKNWGKGFTEWTNATTDTPRFIGHQQPILPKDTGFYDLRFEQNIAEQIARAKKHGIYGFCFYYYWFSGKRLLEKPLESFLQHKEWDFNFAICWANENWTKRWDGRDSEVIIAQKYKEEDPLNFIKDVEHILIDPRYIKENGKPLLIVFRATDLKQPEKYAKVWREYFREKYQTELQLVSIVSFDDKDPRSYGFDAALDFAPQSSFFKVDSFTGNRYPYTDVSQKLIDINFTGSVVDYRSIALNKKTYEYFDFPIYKCVTPSWDNDARKKGNGFVMYYENPDVYAKWLDNILTIETSKEKSPLVFINAWNEWAEGATLEPSMHYGSAVLNRTTEVLSKHSYNKTNRHNFSPWGIKRTTGAKTAVVLHLYYPERWEYLKKKLDLLKDIGVDLFVTINVKNKEFIKEIHQYDPAARVFVVPNRGRDVLPFVHLARRLDQVGYKYVLKLHTKKSEHRNNGGEWFEGLVDNLLPNAAMANKALGALIAGTAIIGPAGHFVSLKRYMGGNMQNLKRVFSQVTNPDITSQVLSKPQDYGYFAGTMFWVSLDALRPLLELHFAPEDFESEKGQIDSTMAHAVERAFSLLPQINKLEIMSIDEKAIRKVQSSDIITNYDFAP